MAAHRAMAYRRATAIKFSSMPALEVPSFSSSPCRPRGSWLLGKRTCPKEENDVVGMGVQRERLRLAWWVSQLTQTRGLAAMRARYSSETSLCRLACAESVDEASPIGTAA